MGSKNRHHHNVSPPDRLLWGKSKLRLTYQSTPLVFSQVPLPSTPKHSFYFSSYSPCRCSLPQHREQCPPIYKYESNNLINARPIQDSFDQRPINFCGENWYYWRTLNIVGMYELVFEYITITAFPYLWAPREETIFVLLTQVFAAMWMSNSGLDN